MFLYFVSITFHALLPFQAKMDVMNLDSQLMEAIHKKIELSQQLERWEIDLETLIEMQVCFAVC